MFDSVALHMPDPYFTVDKTTIYQHINTGVAALAFLMFLRRMRDRADLPSKTSLNVC